LRPKRPPHHAHARKRTLRERSESDQENAWVRADVRKEIRAASSGRLRPAV
jgi:hypothetical protein